MTDIVERLEKNIQCMGHGDYDVDPLSKEAAKEIKRLRKYEWIVKFIHSEPYELSSEKITNQRDYWKQMAKKLIEDESND